MWRIIDRLYLGDSHDAAAREALDAVGVTHILNCTSTVPCSFPDDFKYLQVRVEPEDFADKIDEICKFVDHGRDEGIVFVHCSEAHGRSPAAVMAHLCHIGQTVDEAIQTVKEATRDRREEFAPPPFPLMEPILDRFDS